MESDLEEQPRRFSAGGGFDQLNVWRKGIKKRLERRQRQYGNEQRGKLINSSRKKRQKNDFHSSSDKKKKAWGTRQGQKPGGNWKIFQRKRSLKKSKIRVTVKARKPA